MGSMGVYVCEFEFVEDGDMVLAWPFWPGYAAGTEGCGLEDAVAMAADWLRTMVLDCLAKGEAVPACGFGHEPERGGKVIAVAIEADLSEVPAMTAAEAARTLGISTARVAQLCKAGQLDSWKVGGTRMVSKESVDTRLDEGATAGRPRKDFVTK